MQSDIDLLLLRDVRCALRICHKDHRACRRDPFVFIALQSCIGLGMPDRRVIFRHILPNCLSPIIVTGSLSVATAILIESALSFLGLGDPNVMSWGFMIAAGRTFLRTAWWLCAIPGTAILLTVLAINLVGEGLNDALNPRLYISLRGEGGRRNGFGSFRHETPQVANSATENLVAPAGFEPVSRS